MDETAAIPGHVRRSDRAKAWSRLTASPLSVGALAILAVLLLATLFGPLIVPYPEDAEGSIHPDVRLQAPSWGHPFGTDELGRDVFSRVVLGARISMAIGVIVLVIGVSIGTVLGATAGFAGGRVNEAIMRCTDIMITIPELILALAITAVLGRSLANTMIAIGLVRWPIYCRLVQAQVLWLKTETFVEAAVAAGARPARVLFRQILPNCVSPVIVRASLDLGFAILTAAALGFLGLGAQDPVPEWGALVSDSRKTFPGAWWSATFPGLAIFLTVFASNVLGDALRDILDPRMTE
ncbi:MAG TPA: ABC transporter permease [Candidatus Sulfotelmatobacter sp.]|nr:ABC transporter permease [Candidatus Sulfotelmatobacter sp.]